MKLFRQSLLARWIAAWLLVSAALTALTQFLVIYTGKGSYLGSNAFTQFLSLLVLSLPWFLWAEIFCRLVINWKTYTAVHKSGSIWLLIFLTALILAELFYAAMYRAALGY